MGYIEQLMAEQTRYMHVPFMHSVSASVLSNVRLFHFLNINLENSVEQFCSPVHTLQFSRSLNYSTSFGSLQF